MTAENKISVEKAIELLKAGGKLDNSIVSDLEGSKVKAMDALLLAENGVIVPDGNIVYDDADIKYDPDFDEVDWGEPVAFKHKKKQREELSDDDPTEEQEMVEEIRIILSKEVRNWIDAKGIRLEKLVESLLDNFYKTQKSISKE